METKKILVVDDESIARQRLSRFLREYDPSFQIREARNGIEAVDEIHQFRPDIVFLDVEMPGFNGFEVLQQLENIEFEVVFQTAFDEFAVKAFEENATDYLLKPFSQERFVKALEKALLKSSQANLLNSLNDHLVKAEKYLEKLTYKNGGRLKILPIHEVQYFLSQDHCTCAYDYSGQEHIIDLSIGYLEKQLNPRQFIRCHRNNIVRIQDIQTVGNTSDSNVTLKTGHVFPLSRAQRAKVLASMEEILRL